jgi:hypothetical protein
LKKLPSIRKSSWQNTVLAFLVNILFFGIFYWMGFIYNCAYLVQWFNECDMNVTQLHTASVPEGIKFPVMLPDVVADFN